MMKKEIMETKIIYPQKPKRSQGHIGGGLSKRKFFPIYRFVIKNGWRETNIDYGRGYLDAIRDIERLNK